MAQLTSTPSSLGRPRKPPHPPTDVVCRVRVALKLTQEQMAQEMKCSLSNLRDMEQKHRLPGSHALKANFIRLAVRVGLGEEVKLAGGTGND